MLKELYHSWKTFMQGLHNFLQLWSTRFFTTRCFLSWIRESIQPGVPNQIHQQTWIVQWDFIRMVWGRRIPSRTTQRTILVGQKWKVDPTKVKLFIFTTSLLKNSIAWASWLTKMLKNAFSGITMSKISWWSMPLKPFRRNVLWTTNYFEEMSTYLKTLVKPLSNMKDNVEENNREQ